MRLSSLADYAVVMMSAAARHCGSTCRLNATMLAEETGLPLPTVQKLVSRLSSAGLIESTRGTGGGFRLSRPAAAISMADIIEAVEGPIALTACVDEGRHDCALEGDCRVKPHWNVVNGVVRGALGGVSLASLVTAPTVPLPVRPEPVEGQVSAGEPSPVARRASTGSARTEMKVSL
jgi:FeS assembly SUF system regulator